MKISKSNFNNFTKLIMYTIFWISIVTCEDTDEASQICLTPGCIHAASAIIKSIDEAVDPCADFYQFACGNFIDSTIIPEDKEYVHEFALISDKVKRQLRELLEKPVETYDSRSVTLAKKFYQACMDEEHIEKLGQSVITNLLKKVGGWPIVDGDSWNGDNFTWTSLMQTFRELGLPFGYFIEFSVSTDAKNSSIRCVELDQPSDFGLARDLLVENKYVDIYHKFMVDVAVQLGANRERAEKELKESLEFEIALAHFALPQEERRNYTLLYNPVKIWKLEEQYPGISWLEYLNHILPQEVQLTQNDAVVVVAPHYLKSATEFISKTPARVQTNYAVWRAVEDIIEDLPKDMYKHYLGTFFGITGQTQQPKRWKQCVEKVSDELSYVVSSMYIRKYFDEETKIRVAEVTGYIKKSFELLLENLDWMDEETRQKALAKANKINVHIAYPIELLDDNILDGYYENLVVLRDHYLQSELNINKHTYDFEYKRLFELVNKTDWKNHANSYEPGAWYSGLENTIELAAAILQDTFFNKDRPMYLNFGAIGSIMGHDIIHGFDDEGSQLDQDGNLKNWWNSNTKEHFLNKTQCIIDQYGNYTVTEINENLNGVLTQGENIADNEGIKQAYLAYNKWVQANGGEPKLPALKYTPRQLFWISAAKNWCAKYRPQYLQSFIKTDPHAPNRFRVVGPFGNSEHFSIDFNCKVGSNMNPAHKCSVW